MKQALTTRRDFINTFLERNLERNFGKNALTQNEAIAKDRGVELRDFNDNDIIPLFGSLEAFSAKRIEFAKFNREMWIEEVAEYIQNLSQVRFFADVTLYEGYDPDDAKEIATELRNEIDSIKSDQY